MGFAVRLLLGVCQRHNAVTHRGLISTPIASPHGRSCIEMEGDRYD